MVLAPSSLSAVRRWLPLGVRYLPVAAHRDHRIEVAAGAIHRQRQPAHVRVGDVALVRRRLDEIDGQRREQLHVPAERLLVGGEHAAAVGGDLIGERARGVGERRHGELGGAELGRLELDALARARLAALGLGPRPLPLGRRRHADRLYAPVVLGTKLRESVS